MVQIPFHSFEDAAALVAGASTITVFPGSFTRVNAVADTYALYRVVDLRYRLIPNSTITSAQTASFLPGITDTVPTSKVNNMEALNACVLAVRQTCPTEWVVLNKKDLQGYQPWYKTVVGTPDTAVEIVGNIYVIGTGTETYSMEIRGIFEFKNPVNPSSTPMLVKQKQLLKEKERILKILSTSDTALTPAPPDRLAAPLTSGNLRV